MSRVLLAILWAPVLAAQEQPGVLIRTETRLVLLRCHVVRQDRYVTDLKAEDFELREDGAPRKIALFESAASRASGEALPVEVYLAIDVSHSVVNPNLLDPFLLKAAFLDGLGTRASIAVYAFGGRTRRFTAPTSDPNKLATALSAAYDFAHPGTRLYGSIIQVAREASSSTAPASRIMVVLSDGMDTTKIRQKAAVEAAISAGIPVYPVLLGHERVARLAQGAQRPPGRGGGPGMENPRWLERQARAAGQEIEMQEFAEMGEATGGTAFDPPFMNSAVLKTILQGLVGQIRSQYVIGYYPPAGAGKPGRHNLRLRLLAKESGRIRGGSRTLIY
jgi:VWFA-related protein